MWSMHLQNLRRLFLNRRNAGSRQGEARSLSVVEGCLALTIFVGLSSAEGIHPAYTQLDNGLKVIIYPSHTAPIVSCRLFYVTGSVHEAPGHTGIAHMLEHLLFKGTKTIGTSDPKRDQILEAKIEKVMDSLEAVREDSVKAAGWKSRYDSLLAEQRKIMIKEELWGAYERAGGTEVNAFTSDLMTAYFVTLPKNKVELYLWLESDRMKNAVLREFYPEHDVVMEERRMRVEDSPTGRYWESLMGIFYEAHPYRFPTIGYPSDIKYLTQREAEDHYRRYYKPNNAILVLAGDVDTAWAMSQIKRYFNGIPRGEEFPPVVTQEPPQAGEKRLTVHRADARPRLDILFHTPGFPNEDLYALDVVEGVLSGKSGRLYQKLVKELKLAISASAGNDVTKYTSNFQVSADLDGAPAIDKVEKAVWEVLDDMAKHPISERELQRARNQVVANSIRAVENLDNLATQLAYWEMRGGWENINTFPEAVQKVSAEQVQKVCAKYFLHDAATVGVLLPKGSKP